MTVTVTGCSQTRGDSDNTNIFSSIITVFIQHAPLWIPKPHTVYLKCHLTYFLRDAKKTRNIGSMDTPETKRSDINQHTY